MVSKSVFVTLVLVFLVGVFCEHQPPCPKPPAHCPRTWNYSPTSIPWGKACAGWATCANGQRQSPIDLAFPPALPGTCRAPRFNINYRALSDVFIFNTGNKFIFPVFRTDMMTFDYNGVRYFLTSVEFHSPSEHLHEGRRYNMEMQLIHRSGINAARTLAVSIFFDIGNCLVNCTQTNQFLEQIQYNLPQYSQATCGNGRIENLAGYFSEECDNGPRNSNNSTDPNCCRLDCTRARCGDGVVDTTEQCDNGRLNGNAPGACRANCRLPACGDGILDPREECDDGNNLNKDGCSSICRKECGDGILNLLVEQCDDGVVNNSDTRPNACRTNCRNATCGDGVVDRNEICDDGARNGLGPNQCRPGTCTNYSCGDDITDSNEECDDGALNGVNARCNLNCSLANCGNGRLDAGELCDAGVFNSNAPNALCRTSCTPAKCGDGIIDFWADPPENCDSGAPEGNFWCSPTCQSRCGNYEVDQPGEECDHGCANSDTPDAPCRTDCKLPRCGDGILDRNEHCDHGALNSNASNAACRPDCGVRRCGDGVVDSDEECDNGNGNLKGSGCFMCRTECGNGHLEGEEECDFGQFNSDTVPDCCRKNCRMPRCGDGALDSREECDTGVNNSNTRANACRTNCRFAHCGDGTIDPANGEQCDNGAANSDTAANGCSSDCILNSFRQQQLARNVDLNLAIPSSHDSLAYQGSLTSPPCTEGVQWIVFTQVQKMTKHQFDSFANSRFGIFNNVRPVQKMCNRRISRALRTPVPVCGNGIIEGNEQCDAGLKNTLREPNRCRQNCLLPFKGDGITDSGEECDDGPLGSARCGTDYRFKTTCFNPFVCPAWTYANSCKWGFLCPEWSTCNAERANSAQSPVNLQLSPALGRGKFALHYTYSNINTINVINSGRSVALINDNMLNAIQLPGSTKSYPLQYIKFHSPSEHAINGQHADLEAQFFHTAADGATAVVSVLFNKGKANSLLDQFFFYLPRDTDCRCGNGVKDPNEACDNGARNSNTRPGQCRLNCQLPSCGDGVVDRGEQCDDGVLLNSNASDRCRPNCKLPFCGDGIRDSGEQCDPPNSATCTANCMLLCGNNIVDDGELCDNGPANDDSTPNACRTDCTRARCGDGVIDNDEECDDGFRMNSDTKPGACRASCRLPFCGDNITDPSLGEECDDGPNNNLEGRRCNALCQLACGNGIRDGNSIPGEVEACDNGFRNFNAPGACRTNCLLPACGDFIFDPTNVVPVIGKNEQCDDGPLGSIWCSPDCQLRCGDGIVDPLSEACDDGPLNSDTVPNACRTDCTRPRCGDGVRDAGDMCDFGVQNSNAPNAPCRMNCVLPVCGDGILDSETEECDDGNKVNGDKCSSTCRHECGNGRRDGDEVCDDGNTLATPNTCRPRGHPTGGCVLPRCGDGIVDDGEQCDDGPLNSNAPNACRTNCKYPTSSDGVTDTCFGEKCDAVINGDWQLGGCSSTNVKNECRTYSTSFSTVSLHNALDRTSPVLTYTGSLTNPPCTEGVTYLVLEKISSLSEKQLNMLRSVLPTGNSRGLQPLNGRTVAYTDTYPTVCGDGIVEKGEECDNGPYNANAPNKCRKNTCKKPACGDGILDSGEQCDNGARNGPNGPCGSNCKWAGTPATANCPANGSTTCSTSPSTTINVIFANLLKGAQCATGKCN